MFGVDEIFDSRREVWFFLLLDFPLLNHFYHHYYISIHFFLLHQPIDIVSDVKEKMEKGLNYTILH